MDKGAHFIKCDLELHSPRDANWEAMGQDPPMNPDERRQWAQALLIDCRSKGIQAIAIADHHDLEYAEVVSESADAEVGHNGSPLTAEQRVIVFPAAELTLDPCQALLVFDAGLDWHLCRDALVALGCPPTHQGQPKCGDVMPSSTRVEEVAKKLDEANLRLEGRFILLPNLGPTHRTLLDTGRNLNLRYRALSPVGGYSSTPYVDCKRQIIEGKDPTWGSRAVALIQTSDARKQDFSTVGRNPTWIKLSSFTAEGLRQACLARQSRLQYAMPRTPRCYISRVEVGSCKFFGPTKLSLDLNPQFNAIIGGRGSGKSTLLEYIRWALCDQPPEIAGEDEVIRGEIPDPALKRRQLIENTLRTQPPESAYVRLHLVIDETEHIVTRFAAENRLLLRIGKQDEAPATEAEVRRLIPIQAYSQKQLSSISIRTTELRRLIESPVQQEVNEKTEAIQKQRQAIRDLYNRIAQLQTLDKQIADHSTQSQSLRARVDTLRQQMKDLDPKIQKTLDEHNAYIAEYQLVERLGADVKACQEAVVGALNGVLQLPRDRAAPEGTPQGDLLGKMIDTVATAVDEVRIGLEAARDRLVDASRTLGGQKQRWTQQYNQHQEAFKNASEKSKEYKDRLAQLDALTKQVKQLVQALDQLTAQRNRVSVGAEEEQRLLDGWARLHRKRAALLRLQCIRLTRQSDGDIKAVLKRGGDASDAVDLLKLALKGTRARESHLDTLSDRITGSQNPAGVWLSVMRELKQLADMPADQGDAASLPACPILENIGFTDSILRRIIAKMGIDEWLQLMLTSLQDRPSFSYRVAEQQYIPFDRASPGQQATALLIVLLNQEGGPLLVDQPEEDLDKAIVSSVIERIWLAKERRQIVFVSHDANIVVNGDAELVIHCDYKSEADRSSGCIANEGAIDQPMVCDAIKKVMEGGEEAFKLRQEKYGF